MFDINAAILAMDIADGQPGPAIYDRLRDEYPELNSIFDTTEELQHDHQKACDEYEEGLNDLQEALIEARDDLIRATGMIELLLEMECAKEVHPELTELHEIVRDTQLHCDREASK